MQIGRLLPRGAQRLMFGVLACIPLLAFASPAWASCTASSANANLGPVSSLAVATTSQGVTTSTGFACTSNGTLTLLATNTVRATVQSASNSNGTQPRLHDPATGDYIPYTICKDASCNQPYAINTQIVWQSTTLLGLLNLFTGPGGTLPIYIRTAPGTQVAAGTYRSTITLVWNWEICTLGLLGVCLYDRGTLTRTVGVTMVVSRDCAITAPPVNFGSAALVASFDRVTQSILIRCSKGAAYSVGINNGLHASNGVRRLSDGRGFIGYDIFYPAGSTTRWGNAAPERRSSMQATTNPGAHTGSTSQAYTYTAAVNPSQPTPAGGTYTDTLIVDVQF